jgi:hypothetical protein
MTQTQKIEPKSKFEITYTSNKKEAQQLSSNTFAVFDTKSLSFKLTRGKLGLDLEITSGKGGLFQLPPQFQLTPSIPYAERADLLESDATLKIYPFKKELTEVFVKFLAGTGVIDSKTFDYITKNLEIGAGITMRPKLGPFQFSITGEYIKNILSLTNTQYARVIIQSPNIGPVNFSLINEINSIEPPSLQTYFGITFILPSKREQKQ